MSTTVNMEALESSLALRTIHFDLSDDPIDGSPEWSAGVPIRSLDESTSHRSYAMLKEWTFTFGEPVPSMAVFNQFLDSDGIHGLQAGVGVSRVLYISKRSFSLAANVLIGYTTFSDSNRALLLQQFYNQPWSKVQPLEAMVWEVENGVEL